MNDISVEDSPPKKKRFGMNPDVNTKFLPDRDRDDEVTCLLNKKTNIKM